MQGNRDELKILLQIRLIASQINQELRETRENTSGVKGRFPRKFWTVWSGREMVLMATIVW